MMDEYGKKFGRHYNVVETYNVEKADTVFVALGAIGENIKTAIDTLKEQGKEAGLVQLRLFRPFPIEEVLAAVKDKKNVVVIERVMPAGAPNGPLFEELSAVVHINALGTALSNYIVGLGGRDVLPEDFEEIYGEITSGKNTVLQDGKNFKVIGVRA